MSAALVVLVTVPDRASGDRLARLAVGRKLAACANLLPGVRSLYWWKGKMTRGREELLVLKTRASHWARLSKLLRENHPYTVCEILALRVAAGNPAYLRWITESLKPARRAGRRP